VSEAKVIVLKTSPDRVLEDYKRLLKLSEYQKFLPKDKETLLKLNLSWTKYFPSCSSEPWQLEGVLKTLLEDGFKKEKLIPVENKTVVTDPVKGAENNRWLSVLNKYKIKFTPLTEVEWIKYEFKSKLLKLNLLFPKGIEIPKMFIGKQVIHLPTVKTHGHSITTGAIKNSFGGLLKEFRHYGHKYIHQVLVDLLLMQKEIHPSVFAVMDGTVCGDGAGPRTMKPEIKNYILASFDSVAIDSISAKLMGFDPMTIPYIRICHEKGLGIGDPKEIEIIGEDISSVNFGFKVKKSLVIWGDQMVRKGPLQFLYPLFRSELFFLGPTYASMIYHDMIWYPLIGRQIIKKFYQTEWGKMFKEYPVK